MKTKNDILDVDFIGEQVSITAKEEEDLNDFFRLKKEIKKQSLNYQNLQKIQVLIIAV